METSSGTPQKPDIEIFDQENFLSPLEHDVLGSSVDIPFRGELTKIAGFTSTENKALSIEDLFKEDVHTALAPVGRTNGSRDIEDIQEARAKKNLRLTAFGLYGKDGIVGTSGVKVTLELSDVGEDEEISELRFKFARGENAINPKELGLERWVMEDKYKTIFHTPEIAEDGTLRLNIKKEYKPINNRHLAIVEHALVGSSIEYDGDKFFTADKLIEIYEREGKIPEIFLRPTSLNEGFSLEAVKQERSQKYLTGMISGFGTAVLDLYFEGFLPVIVLPVPDDEGKVKPEWKIFLTDVKTGKRVRNNEALNRLKLDGGLSKVFDQATENDQIILSVKSPKQTSQDEI